MLTKCHLWVVCEIIQPEYSILLRRENVFWTLHFLHVRNKGPKTVCSCTPRMRSQTQTKSL